MKNTILFLIIGLLLVGVTFAEHTANASVVPSSVDTSQTVDLNFTVNVTSGDNIRSIGISVSGTDFLVPSPASVICPTGWFYSGFMFGAYICSSDTSKNPFLDYMVLQSVNASSTNGTKQFSIQTTDVSDRTNSFTANINVLSLNSTLQITPQTTNTNQYEFYYFNITNSGQDNITKVSVNISKFVFNSCYSNGDCTYSNGEINISNINLKTDNELKILLNVTNPSVENVYNLNYTVYGELGGYTEQQSNQINITNILKNISICSPNFLQNYSLMDVNFSLSFTPDTCWYNINGTNHTILSCNNFTSVFNYDGFNEITIYANDSNGNEYKDTSWFFLPSLKNITIIAQQNQNNITVWINDTNGVIDYETVHFFVDTIYPQIDFSFPTPDNYHSQLSDTFIVNVSIIEDNLKNFTYRLYNSTYNLINETTYTSYPTAITWTVPYNGTFYYNVSVYDDVGHYNYTETRQIRINTDIIILSPQNRTYDIINIDLNWSANFTPNWSCYNLNGDGNVSLNNDNTTIHTLAGSNNVVLYANDSSGNWYSDTVYFFVNDTLDLYLNGQNNSRYYELGDFAELQINTTLSNESTVIYIEDKRIAEVYPNATYNWETETFNYSIWNLLKNTNISYSYNTYDSKLYGLIDLTTNGSITDINVNEFTIYGNLTSSSGHIDESYIDDTTVSFTTPGIETTYLNVTQDSENIAANFSLNGSSAISTQTYFGNGLTTQNVSFDSGGGNEIIYINIPRYATIVSANVTITGTYTNSSLFTTVKFDKNAWVKRWDRTSSSHSYDPVYTRGIGIRVEHNTRATIQYPWWFQDIYYSKSFLRTEDISSLDKSGIFKASLFVYGSENYNAKRSVYSVTDSDWSESEITWNTAPSLGSLIDEVFGGNGWQEYIITNDFKTATDHYSIGLYTGYDAQLTTYGGGYICSGTYSKCNYGNTTVDSDYKSCIDYKGDIYWYWGSPCSNSMEYYSRTHATYPPYIKIYNAPSTFKIDTGNDGIYDYEIPILNVTDQEIELNYTAIQDYIDNQCTTDTCSIPLLISSATDGQAQFSNLQIKYSMSPYNIRIDIDEETAYTSSGTFYNASFVVYDIDTSNNRIPIDIYNDRTGTVTITSLDLNYTIGTLNTSNIDWLNISAQNYNGNKITAETTMYYDGSTNMTIRVNNSEYEAEHEAYIYYSNINLTSAYDYWEIVPQTLDSKNVTPYGQSYIIPFDNITALNEHNYNLSVYYDGTVDDCIDIRVCTNYNQTNCITANTTPQWIMNGNLTTPISLWYYVDLNNCTWSARYYDLTWYYSPCCEMCDICNKD